MGNLKTVGVVTIVTAACLVTACAEMKSPTRPDEAALAVPSLVSDAGAAAVTAVTTGHPTPTDLTARGWTCVTRTDRVVCSRPNQGLPTGGNPPPQDRPATFTFWLFNPSGVFTGTQLLIRTDLYNGQLCESTGAPYLFVPTIGYYQCVHTPGR